MNTNPPSLWSAACIGLVFQGILTADTQAQSATTAGPRAGLEKPDVLFIAVDDMNDFPSFLGGYRGKVHTPNMDRLAARGVTFTNAHCPYPLCNPSRTAILTGKRASTTGVYGNEHWWRPNHPKMKTIPMLFKESGYLTIDAGKIYHHTAGANPPDQWDAYHQLLFTESPWMRKDRLNYPWTEYKPAPSEYPYSGVSGLGAEFDWGSLPIEAAEYDDTKTMDYAIATLERNRDKPLFLEVGTYRPHIPLYVPKQYFDMYPLAEIVLPEVKEDDLDDVPEAGRKLARTSDKNAAVIKKYRVQKQIVQAYLASISYADAQIGRLLAALAVSPRGKGTIIVLWSDLGFHLGEKQHWHKRTLWGRATRVPFIIVAPEVAVSGQSSPHPVNLIDIYPTLASLCGLRVPKGLDGYDLTPLLKKPTIEWKIPSVIEYNRGNVAVCSDHYRYIQYADGSEELYDHKNDPHEWTNVAGDESFGTVKDDLKRWATKQWAAPALPKKVFEFDPNNYTWKKRKDGKNDLHACLAAPPL
jgi:arylsulfatase A-like enzyme